MTFPAGRGNAQLHGVIVGTGPVGVVLVHQNRQTGCAWTFYAPELVAAGRSVLLLDLNGSGSSERVGDGRLDLDVVAAVAHLRSQGVSKVVAIGASKGATAVIAAAALSNSGIDGVVSLSAVAFSGQTDALGTVSSLTVPARFLAAASDGSAGEIAQALADDCSCSSKVLILDGAQHGILLLRTDNAPAVQAAIDDLFAAVIPQ